MEWGWRCGEKGSEFRVQGRERESMRTGEREKERSRIQGSGFGVQGRERESM
jgi:hypothetical protein